MHAKDMRRQGPYIVEREEMAEEQGWVARMVHLFRAESLDVQFEVYIFAIDEFIEWADEKHSCSFFKLHEDTLMLVESECGLHSQH
jgi:hypothetical protein